MLILPVPSYEISASIENSYACAIKVGIGIKVEINVTFAIDVASLSFTTNILSLCITCSHRLRVSPVDWSSCPRLQAATCFSASWFSADA